MLQRQDARNIPLQSTIHTIITVISSEVQMMIIHKEKELALPQQLYEGFLSNLLVKDLSGTQMLIPFIDFQIIIQDSSKKKEAS